MICVRPVFAGCVGLSQGGKNKGGCVFLGVCWCLLLREVSKKGTQRPSIGRTEDWGEGYDMRTSRICWLCGSEPRGKKQRRMCVSGCLLVFASKRGQQERHPA